MPFRGELFVRRHAIPPKRAAVPSNLMKALDQMRAGTTIRRCAVAALACALLGVTGIACSARNDHRTITAPPATQATWEQRYQNCFDVWGNPHPDRLAAFIDAAEMGIRRSAASGGGTPQYRLVELAARAKMEAHDWAGAASQLETLIRYWYRPAGQHSTTGDAAELDIHWRLAAVFMEQRRWRVALDEYANHVARRYFSAAATMSIECLAWLAMWTFLPTGGARRGSRPSPLRELAPLCLIPVCFAAFTCISVPLNSCLLFGNPAEGVVSMKASQFDEVMYLVEEAALLYAFARYTRNAGKGSNRPGSPADRASSGTRPAVKRPIVRALWIGIAAVVGVYLTGLPLPQRYTHIIDAMAGANLMALPLSILLLPALEEALYRGAVYPYAARLGGQVFAAGFSALLFAGEHLRWGDHYHLLWVGVVYAGLYELTGTITASTAAHSVYNAAAEIAAALNS